MITIFQAVVIGLIQGFTELFPISSLGHSVLVPQLLGWHIGQNSSYFLTFLVATHLATALVLFAFFWKDWVAILRGLGRSIVSRSVKDDAYAKLGWLLVVATIPAGALGLALEKPLRRAFASGKIAATFLIVNGLILFAAERLRKQSVRSRRRETEQQSDENLTRLTFGEAVGIGTAQAAALIPGISRSGSSMAAGMHAGLSHEDAARFSFLLATPVIGAAAFLKLPELFKPSAAPMRTAILVGALCAAITAFLSVRFLVKYFQTNTLAPFARYCFFAGIIFLGYLTLK